MKPAGTRMIVGMAALSAALGACGQEDGGAPVVPPASPEAPSASQTASVAEQVRANPELGILTESLSVSGLAATLAGAGPFTVFAPTNTAFEKLTTEERGALAGPGEGDRLRRVLSRHVAPGRLTLDQIAEQADAAGGTLRLTALDGTTLTLREEDGRWRITDVDGRVAFIAMPDVVAANGVVHAVDTVLGSN